MQLELGEALRTPRHQPGVVRAGADFREPDLLALDEQLDAENTASAKLAGNRRSDLARP